MRWLKWLARVAAFLLLIAVIGVAWVLGTESGLRWALGFAPPELVVEEPRGSLLGTISLRRISFQENEARNVSFELNLLALFADTVSVEFFRADSITLQRPKEDNSGKTSATLPVRIRIADAQVKSLVF